jgi:hypothetical protein
MLIYLVRIPHCQGTPYNATCLGSRSYRINGVKRVASDRRDLNPPAADRIEQPLPNFVRCLLLYFAELFDDLMRFC